MDTNIKAIASTKPEHLEAAKALSHLPLDPVDLDNSTAVISFQLNFSEALYLIEQKEIPLLLERLEGPIYRGKDAVAGWWAVWQHAKTNPDSFFSIDPLNFEEGSSARMVLDRWLEFRTSKAGGGQNGSVSPGVSVTEVYSAFTAEVEQLRRYIAAQEALLKAWLA